MLLKTTLPANIVARILALLASTLLIIMLYLIPKNLWKSTAVGMVAALFATFNGFQIYMSRSAESYSLLPAFLSLAFYFLLKALNNQEKKFWVLASVFFVVSFYTNQMSLLFVLVGIVGLVISFIARNYEQTKSLLVYHISSVSLCLPWLFIQRHAIFSQINQAPQDYISIEKLLRILTHYYSMLGNWVFVVFFLFGVGKILHDIFKKGKVFDSLLLAWIFLPCVYFLSKSMWINPHHMFFVFPPVILIAAYGACHLFYFLIEKTGGRYLASDRPAYTTAFFLFFLTISVLQIKLSHLQSFPGAAQEFGESDIVSRACDYIKENYNGEIVIAPIGLSEGYYLDMFVHDKNKNHAVQKLSI
jgi:4-amino-4-deoxy-L-arabinose transferase-like glycosyltransferase